MDTLTMLEEFRRILAGEPSRVSKDELKEELDGRIKELESSAPSDKPPTAVPAPSTQVRTGKPKSNPKGEGDGAPIGSNIPNKPGPNRIYKK
jgi:hypothetical protein